MLINNAGISLHQNLVDGDLDKIRLELETNFFGTLNVVRAFTPGARDPQRQLAPVAGSRTWAPAATRRRSRRSGASRTAIRLELPDTLVTGLYLSSTDTDMMAGWDIPKNDPAEVVRDALDGLEADALEVIADEDTAMTKAELSGAPALA